MNVLSQKEMFPVSTLAPGEIPRLTPFMIEMLTVLIYKTNGCSLGPIRQRWALTRTLRSLIRKGCVEARTGMPAKYTVTRLGRIARELRK